MGGRTHLRRNDRKPRSANANRLSAPKRQDCDAVGARIPRVANNDTSGWVAVFHRDGQFKRSERSYRSLPTASVESGAPIELCDAWQYPAEFFCAGLWIGSFSGDRAGPAQSEASIVRRLSPPSSAPLQFRTRNGLTETRRTQTNPTGNPVKSTKAIDSLPLITVWLQVRVLPGPPRFALWASRGAATSRGLLPTKISKTTHAK